MDPSSFEFLDTPLSEVAEYLAEEYGIAVHIDRNAIEDIGIDVDVPMTGSGSNRTLRSALTFLFKETDLEFVIKNETLIITTPDAIATHPDDYLVSKMYDLTQLVGENTESVVTTIEQNVATDSWFDSSGGYATINLLSVGSKKILAISHTSENHHRIKDLLENLGKFSSQN